MAPFDGKYMASYLRAIVMFVLCLSLALVLFLSLSLSLSQPFTRYSKTKWYAKKPWKLRKMSQRRKATLAPFDLKCSILYIGISLNDSYTATYVYAKAYRQTQTSTHSERGDDYETHIRTSHKLTRFFQIYYNTKYIST